MANLKNTKIHTDSLKVGQKLTVSGASIVIIDNNGTTTQTNISGSHVFEGFLNTVYFTINASEDLTFTKTTMTSRVGSIVPRIISLTAAATVTAELHGNGKIVTLDLLAGFDTTLPAATGGGDTFHFIIGTVPTSNDYGILADSTDIFKGNVVVIDTDTVADSASGFATAATTDKIEMNGTTKGALTVGDTVKFIDATSGVWYVEGVLTASGTIVTPFAAT